MGRFLNPELTSLPDIDLDFCFERRGEVIQYVRERYGRESVGQIITFGTLKARAAFRDVARTLRIEQGEVDRFTKMIPAGPGVTNGISAVTTAHFNGSPLVVLAGRAPDGRWGSGSLQELDHPPLLAPVT